MKALFLTLLSLQLFASFSPVEVTDLQLSDKEKKRFFKNTWGKFKSAGGFGCYSKAHVVSYQLYKEYGYTTSKVFFFFGNVKSSINWAFHVAPMIKINGREVMIDRSLFNGFISKNGWISHLSKFGNGKRCKEIYSYSEYEDKKSQYSCLYLETPMYNYIPKTWIYHNLSRIPADQLEQYKENWSGDLHEENRIRFEESELRSAMGIIHPFFRKKYQSQYPF